MDALPKPLPLEGMEAFTGLNCPDCRGSLTVRLHRHHAFFTCRVGHAYSTDELIAGKEAALEARLWEAVYAFEEMAVLLADLDRYRLAELDMGACRERAALAGEQALRLRSIVQADHPLVRRGAAGPAVGP